MNRRLFFIFVIASSVLSNIACTRKDSTGCTHETSDKLEKLVAKEFRLKDQTASRDGDFHAAFSNALTKARIRIQRGEESQFIPVYLKLSPAMDGEHVGQHKVIFSFWGCGLERAWNDENQIWMIFAREDDTRQNVEVVESSLANLTHGRMKCWNDDARCGWFDYRCTDPFLGFSVPIKANWFHEIKLERMTLYCFLGNAREYGERIGRKSLQVEKWERKIQMFESWGLISRMKVLFSDDQSCWMECQ